ncbi:hypothetical protein EK904_007862 [Melospiza melodia maxima]|nr:hypothetical protein EK904_007862 [Melospiza melodia maxima]
MSASFMPKIKTGSVVLPRFRNILWLQVIQCSSKNCSFQMSISSILAEKCATEDSTRNSFPSQLISTTQSHWKVENIPAHCSMELQGMHLLQGKQETFIQTFSTVLKLLDVPELLKHHGLITHPTEQESTVCSCHLVVTPLRFPH